MHRLFCSLLFSVVLVLPVPAVSADKTINVFVSILPQKYLVERIGGERVKVSVMVKPGLNPETYEPTPKQMAALNDADLYFRIAVPFESIWIRRIASLNPEINIVECCGGLLITDPVTHDQESETDDQLVNDAHIWTSPVNAVVLAEIIKTALSEFDPEHNEYYANNHRLLAEELEALDQYIRTGLADIKNRYLLVAHPSWGHYAKAYGLNQISIERHGSEIRAKELSKLIEFAKREKIHTVYVQKQFNIAAASIVARDINARLVELDPLAEDYINNLRYVTKLIITGAEPL